HIRMQRLYEDLDAHEDARELEPEPLPLKRRVLRRAARHGLDIGDVVECSEVLHIAAVLQITACRIPADASARQRRMVLERLAAKAGNSEVRAILFTLLALDVETLRWVLRLIARVADSPVFLCQPVPRRNTGPPAPRHVATPIVAHAPPARLVL